MISETKFSRTYRDYDPAIEDMVRTDADPLDLTINEQLVIDSLKNITINTFHRLNWWNETASITRSTTHNIYSFSSRVRLLLPYGLSLLVSLPFLAVGVISLHRNGVPAIEGGFIQYLVTTTGSSELMKAAARESATPHNVSKDLRRRKIRFHDESAEDRDPTGEVRRSTFVLADDAGIKH